MHPLMILPTGSGKTNWALAFAIACALALPGSGNPLCDALTIQDTEGRPAESSQDRRRLVDSFILRCLRETGETVTRKMIWRSAGYHDATEFERWQRNDPRATKRAERNFARVLSMSPHDFVGNLKKLKPLPNLPIFNRISAHLPVFPRFDDSGASPMLGSYGIFRK